MIAIVNVYIFGLFCYVMCRVIIFFVIKKSVVSIANRVSTVL